MTFDYHFPLPKNCPTFVLSCELSYMGLNLEPYLTFKCRHVCVISYERVFVTCTSKDATSGMEATSGTGATSGTDEGVAPDAFFVMSVVTSAGTEA